MALPFEVPPLRLSDVVRLSKDGTLDAAIAAGPERWAALFTVIHAAAVRADASLTVDQVADQLDLANWQEAFNAALAIPAAPAVPQVPQAK